MHIHFFDSSSHTLEVDPFFGETFVSIHASISTPLGALNPSRSHLRIEMTTLSLMEIEPPVDCAPESFPVSQTFVQADQNEIMEPSPSAWEAERPLQKGTNRLSKEPTSLTFILQMRIPFCNLLLSIHNLHYVLGGLEQPAEEKPTSMNFHAQSRSLVVVGKKGWQRAALGLKVHPKYAVWQPRLDVCMSS